MASPTPPRFIPDARGFVPGQVLAERYRMVGLLGKGGMGEVYRADDMKLGQPVALKFLPRDVEHDKDRSERFLTEVRLSLKVTHPNVCRVFDIAEADGRHFISMEYVDGEDLASLLRRIGRLPEDKAVEIARQLCAGLAAAHDEGVLHRDLKPANIMIDGRGRAKITDFGLAGATAGVTGREAQAGTPQYMAPEQFDGRELTVQTDLYSLGLVLYELFTGKRAFDGRDLLDLQKMRSSTVTNPSAHVSGLNPVVERAILRCLEPDPQRRPKSAESLAAALPGGDPLAMAIAAGETPSPEMVARSGGAGELRPSIALACFTAVLIGLGLACYTDGGAGIHSWIPLQRPPAELRLMARAALAAAGYAGNAASTAQGFGRDGDYFNRIATTNQSPGRWNNLATVEPAPVYFWYRESPRPMTPFGRFGALDYGNPPRNIPGMTLVRLDPRGHLQEFIAVPPELQETTGPWKEPDWSPLFSSAALVMNEWSAADPTWGAPHASDVRRAWTKGTMRLEAAAFRGRPVWFTLVPEWRRPTEIKGIPTRGEMIGSFIITALQILVIVGGALLARRNIRQGRSDRRGAFRLAVTYLGLGIAFELVRLRAHPQDLFDTLQNNFAKQLFFGLLIWLFYLAIEPYVRRVWPGTLVAWSRVLEGRFRDPLVGRHILLGALAGMGFTLLFALPSAIPPLLGIPAPAPQMDLWSLASTRDALATLIGGFQASVFLPVAVLLAVLVLRVICRRPWIAYALMFVIVGVIGLLNDVPWIHILLRLFLVALLLIVLTRLGLLAMLVGIAFSNFTALTIDPDSWYFAQSMMTIGLFAAIAAYGCWVSIGTQKVFQESLLEA